MNYENYELGNRFEIIAERELATSADGRVTPVHARIGKPIEISQSEWICPYQIVGLGDEKVRVMVGIDSIQALQHAVYILEVLLDARGRETQITFLNEPGHGFTPKHFVEETTADKSC